MIYRSNLTAPDLQPYFKHTICRVMPHSQGHDVLSDFADKPDTEEWRNHKQCGFWTHDEAAILYNVARAVGERWLDIGGHTGWTAAHLLAAGCEVISVDPEYVRDEFRDRVRSNLIKWGLWRGCAMLSVDFFDENSELFSGIVIDGDHSAPAPLLDAVFARMRVLATGVILFHDARGEPIKVGVRWVARFPHWHVKLYHTPHGVALCYQDGFTPPEHTPAPDISEFSL